MVGGLPAFVRRVSREPGLAHREESREAVEKIKFGARGRFAPGAYQAVLARPFKGVPNEPVVGGGRLGSKTAGGFEQLLLRARHETRPRLCGMRLFVLVQAEYLAPHKVQTAKRHQHGRQGDHEQIDEDDFPHGGSISFSPDVSQRNVKSVPVRTATRRKPTVAKPVRGARPSPR